jgi:ATP-dependent DNA helicase DinG
LSGALAAFRDQLEPLAQSSKGLESCWRRSAELGERLELVTDNVPENYIHWFETHKRGFVFHLTPMNVADAFRNYVQAHKRAWVFTSATLTVNDRFDHFTSQLGLENAQTSQWTSPFDYARQALMYIPAAMPAPNERQYTQAVVEAALPVIEASRGRAFLLFTSHRALSIAHDLVRDRLDYELLVQGSMPRSKLLDRFRHAGNAVLMGTSSFWEGVDVRGEALSCVIVDKLPFAPPDDPIIQARIEALREQGGNPFRDFQLPSAVIALKQGFGRLIRDTTDRGVIMICDPRLLTKSYGKVFINSLPPVPLTHDLEQVCRFLEQTNQLQSKTA